MRASLIGWLIKAHDRINLLLETLFLCINYINRFLSNNTVDLKRLDLLGGVSLLLAAKYEEIDHPTMEDIIYFC